MANYTKELKSILRKNGRVFKRQGKEDHEIRHEKSLPDHMAAPTILSSLATLSSIGG